MNRTWSNEGVSRLKNVARRTAASNELACPVSSQLRRPSPSARKRSWLVAGRNSVFRSSESTLTRTTFALGLARHDLVGLATV
ncbi:MAG: hypothetical protein WDO56_18415 [Gammaproteobacteria bacterium]